MRTSGTFMLGEIGAFTHDDIVRQVREERMQGVATAGMDRPVAASDGGYGPEPTRQNRRTQDVIDELDRTEISMEEWARRRKEKLDKLCSLNTYVYLLNRKIQSAQHEMHSLEDQLRAIENAFPASELDRIQQLSEAKNGESEDQS